MEEEKDTEKDSESNARPRETLQAEVDKLLEENKRLRVLYNAEQMRNRELHNDLMKFKFSADFLTKNESKMLFYTGISVALFNWLVSVTSSIDLTVPNVHLADQILIVLVKLKLGCSNMLLELQNL